MDDGEDPGAPAGADVATPFPIDRGDEGESTPGTYKGLWLRLVDNGEPSVTPVDGVIGVGCVGMSNGRQECDAYRSGVSQLWASEIDPAVRVANCAVGGHAIERWIDPAFDGALWEDCIGRKLDLAGIRVDRPSPTSLLTPSPRSTSIRRPLDRGPHATHGAWGEGPAEPDGTPDFDFDQSGGA